MVLSLAMLLGAVLGASGAAAALKQPPKSVLILKAAWDADGETPASPSFFPVSTLEAASKEASNRLERISAGSVAIRSWSTTVRGAFQIAAPGGGTREEEAFQPQIDCRSRFFLELTARTDAEARAAGVNPDAFDLVVYDYEAPVCASMPDGVVSAGLVASDRRIVFQGEMSAGDLLHMVGHYMGLGHAGTIVCKNARGEQVQLEPVREAERCQTSARDDVYDVMGSARGAGGFSAAVQSALGWLGPPGFGNQVFDLGELNPTDPTRVFEIGTITEGLRVPQRAIKVKDGRNVFWIEYRNARGTDVGLDATPGLVVRREIGRTAAGAPITQLLDMEPESPLLGAQQAFRRAALLPPRSWANPAGLLEVKLLRENPFATTAFVQIGSQLRP